MLDLDLLVSSGWDAVDCSWRELRPGIKSWAQAQGCLPGSAPLPTLGPKQKSPAQILQGWQVNSIVTLETGQPWNVVDTGNDISLTGEGSDRWNFFGNAADFTSSSSGPIPFFADGTQNPACATQALASQLSNLDAFPQQRHDSSQSRNLREHGPEPLQRPGFRSLRPFARQGLETRGTVQDPVSR
jgi:hypothetical protein